MGRVQLTFFPGQHCIERKEHPRNAGQTIKGKKKTVFAVIGTYLRYVRRSDCKVITVYI